jgi:hypothetical protein
MSVSRKRKIVAGEVREALIRRAPAEVRKTSLQVDKYMEVLTRELKFGMNNEGLGENMMLDDFQLVSEWEAEIHTGAEDKPEKVSGRVASCNVFLAHII